MGKVRLLFVLLIAVTGGCGGESAAERAAANKELVRRYYQEIFNQGRIERLGQFIAPGYVEVHEGTEHEIGIEGAEQHARGIRRVFPDLKITIEQQIAEGEIVVSRITARGTQKAAWLGMEPTGAYLEFTGVNIDRVVNGRIVRHGGAANLLGPLMRAGSIAIVRPVIAEKD